MKAIKQYTVKNNQAMSPYKQMILDYSTVVSIFASHSFFHLV